MKTFDRSFLKNQFKMSLQNKPQLGMWLASTSHAVAEIAAGSGYDFLIIEGEHSPNTNQTILNQAQAVASHPNNSLFVRIADHSRTTIKQMLDLGIQNLIVPMVENKEQAEHIAASMYYPPKGKRGFGALAVRGGQWLRLPNYLDTAEDELCIFAQIESKKGVENADDIIHTEGITGIFLGPADLALDMGYKGDFLNKEMQALIKNLLSKIRQAGKFAGTIASSPEEAKRYIDWGANFVAIGSDTILYALALDNHLATFKKGIEA